MKSIYTLLFLFITILGYTQPNKIIKKFNLKEKKLNLVINNGTIEKISLPRVYSGKWGTITYTSDKQTVGFTIDSVTLDTTYYNLKVKSNKNGMREAPMVPPSHNDAIEPPLDLLNKEAPSQMRALSSAVAPLKKFEHYYVVDYWTKKNDFSDNSNLVIDWIVLLHTTSMEFSKAGGQDIECPIVGIHIYPNFQNPIDSMWDDTRYQTGIKTQYILYKIANLFWQAGGNITGHVTTRRLSAGGLAYRNPTLTRAAAAFVLNCSRLDATTGLAYTFGKGALPHESLGHGLGLPHTFVCNFYTNRTGAFEKVDSSYNEGSCTTPIKPSLNGDILSYQHLLSFQGGRITPRWNLQSLNNSWINLANTSNITGSWLGGSTLTVDSLMYKRNTYKLTIKVPANMNGTKYELYENNSLVLTIALTQSQLNRVITYTKPNGNYYYVGKLINDRQIHPAGGFTVRINTNTNPVCIPTYSNWSNCVNNIQTRTVTNNCSAPLDSTTRTCNVAIPTVSVYQKVNGLWYINFTSLTNSSISTTVSRFTNTSCSTIAATGSRTSPIIRVGNNEYLMSPQPDPGAGVIGTFCYRANVTQNGVTYFSNNFMIVKTK